MELIKEPLVGMGSGHCMHVSYHCMCINLLIKRGQQCDMDNDMMSCPSHAVIIYFNIFPTQYSFSRPTPLLIILVETF